MERDTMLSHLGDIQAFLKNPDSNTDDEIIVQKITEILSCEKPDYRDMLAGIMKDEPDVSMSLLLRTPTEGRHILNVINLMIILSVYTDQYYEPYVEKGYLINKKEVYGTTMFDYIASELEFPDPDMDSLVEGYFTSSVELMYEYGLR